MHGTGGMGLNRTETGELWGWKSPSAGPFSCCLEVAGAHRFGLWSSLASTDMEVKSAFLLDPCGAPEAVRTLTLTLGPHLQMQE